MTALITGASSGIGLQYATLLAKEWNADLLLVSNQEKELQETADFLRDSYGVKVDALCIDLTGDDAAETVYSFAAERSLEIDILINNAGVFFFDKFIDVDPLKIDGMMALHMETPTRLCRLFGADMCRRGHGYILNMSSVCAWMTFPGLQMYESTKNYLLTFSKGIRHEFRQNGVVVTVVTPGAVDTPLYGLSEKTRRKLVRWQISLPPEKLARKALKAMFAEKKTCMPGVVNHLLLPLLRILPDSLVGRIMKRLPMFR